MPIPRRRSPTSSLPPATKSATPIGYYGATLAWIFVSFFGFAGLLFPAALLVIGWNRFWGREIEYFHTKLIGFLVVALSLPPLFDLALGKLWLRGSLIASGGYLGQEINRTVSGNLNTSGAVNRARDRAPRRSAARDAHQPRRGLRRDFIAGSPASAADSRCIGRASLSAGAKRR